MKTIIVIVPIIISLLTLSLYAQTPEWEWAQSAGGAGSDYAMGDTDSSGNHYISGAFTGSMSFGTITLTANDARTIYIAKLDALGNWLWAIKTPGSDDQWGNKIAVDNAGNVYLAGGFDGTIVFGNTSLSINHGEDIFVAKLDTNGNWLWAKQAGGYNWDYPQGMDVDASGNVYISGKYDGACTFGQLTLPNSGSADIFVAKLDANGNWLWAVNAGGSDEDNGQNITIDANGNAYVTGTFSGTANFGTHTISAIQDDTCFLAKLDNQGSFLWAMAFSGVGGDDGGVRCSLTTDSIGNVYFTGAFEGTAPFGPYQLTSNGDRDIFIIKLDPSGNVLWVRQAGGIGTDVTFDTDIDTYGRLYVAGYFGFTSSFGATSLTSHGGPDMFLAKLDANGNWLWAISAGGLGDDAALSISLDSSGNGYASGVFQGSIILGDYALTSAGGQDLFVAKTSNITPVLDPAQVTELTLQLTNSPNPFFENTRISYELIKSGMTEISIFNSRGQIVRRLMSESKAAGQHTISWDGYDDSGKALASGMYLCRISTAGKQETHKMLLMK